VETNELSIVERMNCFSGMAALTWIVRGCAAVFIFVATASISSAADLSVAEDFFPKADQVVIEKTSGRPPSSVVRARDGRILGYAFSTRDVSGSVGFSGRPLDIVAAVTPEGVIAGARIVAHEEPILVIGIPREALFAYVAAFKGFNVRAAGVRQTDSPGKAPRVVAGASITSAVIRDAIVRSARAVLRSRATTDTEAGKPRLDRETLRRASWPALVAQGAIRHLLVSRGEAARLTGTQDDEPDKVFIDLWLALATPPAIGESLVGQREYESMLGSIAPNDNLLLIAANGLYSFKGTEWRRSGVFDRIEIIQGSRTIRLQEKDHRRIDRIRAPGAPEFREIGLFRIPHDTGFDPTLPFRLDLSLAPSQAGGAPAVVSLDYRIPDAYLIKPATAPPAEAKEETVTPGATAPLWHEIWIARRYEIVILGLMLAGLGAILIFQDMVTARGQFYRALRASYLVLTLVFLGLFAKAQLSVVNVVTFVHALLSGFRWDLFLLDPLVFMLWSFVAVSILFWGRGVFCGWLCPFGALQELLNMVARKIGLKQIDIPFSLHERLWMIKYVLFLGILAISLNSIKSAFAVAEVEPFKTAITLTFMRDWPLVAYAVALLAVGLFVERFYCRYLCPLGGALAIPARLHMFEWLKRYRECGAECQVCARRCTVQAIHPLGQINPNECIHCLKCQANYFDLSVCQHLKKRAERRRPRPSDTPASAVTTQPGQGGPNVS